MTKPIDYKQLKDALSFPTVLSHYGISHNPDRVQDQISCPFHDDNKPSFSIKKDVGWFRCFGCETSGNTLEFVCRMENLNPDIPQDLNTAARIAVVDILGKQPEDFPLGRRGRTTSKRPIQPTRIKREKATETKTLPVENKPLTFELQNLEPEHAEFEKRGVSPEMIETFGLGFYDQKGMMKGRLVFPIHNREGELVAYCGCWHDDNPPEGEGKDKRPNGFNKSIELYNQHRAKEMLKQQDWDKPLIIVEGYWSVIRLHQAGYPAVATFGHDLSEKQALLIATMTQDAVIIYDGDDAGQKGMAKAVATLAQHAFVKTIVLAEGEKPDVMDLEQIAIAVE